MLTCQMPNIDPPVAAQKDMHQNAVLEAHSNGSCEHDIDLERSNQQGAHSPLMSVVDVFSACPCREQRPKQSANIRQEGLDVGGVESDPEAVAAVRGVVGPQAG